MTGSERVDESCSLSSLKVRAIPLAKKFKRETGCLIPASLTYEFRDSILPVKLKEKSRSLDHKFRIDLN